MFKKFPYKPRCYISLKMHFNNVTDCLCAIYIKRRYISIDALLFSDIFTYVFNSKMEFIIYYVKAIRA